MEDCKPKTAKRTFKMVRNEVFPDSRNKYTFKMSCPNRPPTSLPRPSAHEIFYLIHSLFNTFLGCYYHFSNYFDLLVFMFWRENICQKTLLKNKEESNFADDDE